MRFLAAIGAIAIVVAIAAGVYLFGGFYNVAASVEDAAIVEWALAHIRDASMKRHASEPSPIKLDDAETIQAGAREFAEHGCANCHGAPGINWSKFAEGLNPNPPDLKEEADSEPVQLFWAIKNGIRMTGMPSFGKVGVPDKDIWQIVAFIKKLPSISEADYKSWTAPPPAATVTIPPQGTPPAPTTNPPTQR
jgi:mono/diheme cytochrome c family protein